MFMNKYDGAGGGEERATRANLTQKVVFRRLIIIFKKRSRFYEKRCKLQQKFRRKAVKCIIKSNLFSLLHHRKLMAHPTRWHLGWPREVVMRIDHGPVTGQEDHHTCTRVRDIKGNPHGCDISTPRGSRRQWNHCTIFAPWFVGTTMNVLRRRNVQCLPNTSILSCVCEQLGKILEGSRDKYFE